MSLNLKAAGKQQKLEAWQSAESLCWDESDEVDRCSVAVNQQESAAFGLGTYQDAATSVQHGNLV